MIVMNNREGDQKRQKEEILHENEEWSLVIMVKPRKTEASSQTLNDSDYRESDPCDVPFANHFHVFQERMNDFISKFTDGLR